MTQVIEDLAAWRGVRETLSDPDRLGLVPTMGNLHPGHFSLMERAREENDFTVVSLFVNPTQFDERRDLEAYPRTFEADLAHCRRIGIDWLLFPGFEDLYPQGYRYRVSNTELGQRFCGRHRPGHFDGVLTIVLKLLTLVRPHRAYFGEKDYQQLQLVRGMVEDFFLAIEIVPCPIVRDRDGLALSSRNAHLSESERALARRFPAILQKPGPAEEIAAELTRAGFEVDYVEDFEDRRLAAVRIGKTRLIDNVSR